MSKDWDSYLSKTTSRRDFANTYISRRSFGDRVRSFFVSASQLIERPFTRTRTIARSPVARPFVKSESLDLSHISSEETFVITGKSPSKAARFWRKLKNLFKDDERPRVPYNAKHQFPIRGQRPSTSEMARQRKREMADSIDLSAIALTIEKGKIK